MTHRSALLTALLLTPLAALAADRPNVVLILADDLGVRDLGCFGSTFHETPNLDRLASRGVRLTNAYSASPLCSPTRASIMVGQHPARTGITAPGCHLAKVHLKKQLLLGDTRVHLARSVTRLKPDFHTLAEALKDAGYATGHFGKWHLGHNLAGGDTYEPRDQGFDLDWPHTPRAPGPGGGYLAPWKFIGDSSITDEAGRPVDERMADEAGQFIRANKERPFFVNFWLFSVRSRDHAERPAAACPDGKPGGHPETEPQLRPYGRSMNWTASAITWPSVPAVPSVTLTASPAGQENVPSTTNPSVPGPDRWFTVSRRSPSGRRIVTGTFVARLARGVAQIRTS